MTGPMASWLYGLRYSADQSIHQIDFATTINLLEAWQTSVGIDSRWDPEGSSFEGWLTRVH